MRRRRTALVLPLALAGCAISRDPLPRPSPAPVAYREPAATGPAPDAEWWRAFGSPELTALVARALASNTDIAAAAARVRQADAQARIAGAALLPTLDLAPSVTPVRRLNTRGERRVYTDFSGVFSAAYEFDFWGKNRASRDAARALALAARYDRDTLALTTAAAVATAYIDLLSLREQRVAAEANLVAARAYLAGLLKLERAGSIPHLQVVQQQVQVDLLVRQLPVFRNDAAHTLDALALLVNASPETLAVAGEPLAVPSLGAGLPSALLARRPDVAAAEARLAAANADVVVARAQLRPDVNLVGQGGVQALRVASRLTAPTLAYNLALGLVQPIFAGGRLRAQVDLGRARQAELIADYAGTVGRAYADVEDALSGVRAAERVEATQRAALAEAEDALRLAQAGFRSGLTSRFAVLTAEASLFPQRTAMAEAHAARLASLAALFKALGGGWRTGRADGAALVVSRQR